MIRSGRRRTVIRVLTVIWLPILLLAAWWFSSAHSSSPYFPPLSQIFVVFGETWFFGHFFSDLVPSVYRFIAGLAVAIVVGTLLGVVIGQRSNARRALAPALEFLRAVPAVALLPAFLTVLGFGDGMKIAFIAFGCFWPILLNTIAGVRAVDPLQLEMARAYGLTPGTRLTRIIIRSAMPQMFAGLRVALAIGLIVMVFSEMLASSNGVGLFIIQAQQSFAIPEMWSGIFVLGLLGLLVNVVFILIERRALRWYRGWRGTNDH